MATATKTKTWIDGEKLRYDDANSNFNTIFTFYNHGGSVVCSDGGDAFTADQPFPYRLATTDQQALRKRQADFAGEITDVGCTAGTTCWLHAGAHAAPAVGVPYMMVGDSIIDVIPASSSYDVPLPAAFPTDILSAHVWQGDNLSIDNSTQLYVETTNSTLSKLRIVCAANSHIRVQWLVVGW